MARPHLTETEIQSFRSEASEAALSMIGEDGVSQLSLRRLAKRLGCSYAKPYTYFRDKEHLLDAVRGRAFGHLADYMTAALAAPPSGPFGAPYLQFAFDHPEAFRLMFELRQEYMSPETREAQARAWKACTQAFHDAVAAGVLEGDPELIAHVAWAALHGLASLALANQLYLGKSVEEVAEGLEAVMDGFRPLHARGGAKWLS